MKDDFLDLLDYLDKAGVDFVIVGGFAAVAHGCTLVTQDIDICCDFSVDNLLELQKALADLRPVHRMTPHRIKLSLTAEGCKGLNNLYLDTDLGQLDCVSFIQGVGDFETVKARSQSICVAGRKYCVLDIDALILAKKLMDRPRDKEAVIQLESIKELQKKEGQDRK